MARTKSWDYDQTVVFNLGNTNKPKMYRININTLGNELEQEDFAKYEKRLKEKLSASEAFQAGLADVGLSLTMEAPYNPDAEAFEEW